MSEPPRTIHLQWYGDSHPIEQDTDPAGVTWSKDRIYENDIQYVRRDTDVVGFWLHRNAETGQIEDVEMIEVIPMNLEFNNVVDEVFQEVWPDVLCDAPENAQVVRLRILNERSPYSPNPGMEFEIVGYKVRDEDQERNQMGSESCM